MDHHPMRSVRRRRVLPSSVRRERKRSFPLLRCAVIVVHSVGCCFFVWSRFVGRMRWTFWGASSSSSLILLVTHNDSLPESLLRHEAKGTDQRSMRMQKYIHFTHQWMQQSHFRIPSSTKESYYFSWSSSYHNWVVELQHCDLSHVNASHFVAEMVLPVVPRALEEVMRREHLRNDNEEASVVWPSLIEADIIEAQLIGQLVEQYVTAHRACNFSLYRPTVPADAVVLANSRSGGAAITYAAAAFSWSERSGPESSTEEFAQTTTRLLFLISAFSDVPQLEALVAAIHLPQHFIVLHIDLHCDAEVRQHIQDRIVARYDNVWCVQFGAVVYRTDSLSLINLRLLRWLTFELHLPYDYAILCDGAAFPLHTPDEFIQILERSTTMTLDDGFGTKITRPRHVWLGALTHRGQSVAGTAFDHLLRHKRLLYTTGSTTTPPQRPEEHDPDPEPTMNWTTTTTAAAEVWKFHQRLPRRIWSQMPAIPEHIKRHMIYKSTSGNQGVYHRQVVEQLLNSDSVMELFALSKYGCCCCLEEHNWIAALSMIGYAEEALEKTSMFQVWGGTSTTCQGSMANAVLTRNASLCYRSEDAHRNGNTSDMYLLGDALWEDLVHAKQQRGVLMARKFRSSEPEMMRSVQDLVFGRTSSRKHWPAETETDQ